MSKIILSICFTTFLKPIHNISNDFIFIYFKSGFGIFSSLTCHGVLHIKKYIVYPIGHGICPKAPNSVWGLSNSQKHIFEKQKFAWEKDFLHLPISKKIQAFSIFMILLTAVLRYIYKKKNQHNLMCIIWWIWIYAYAYKAITIIKVINIFSFWFMLIYKTHVWVF